MEFIHTVTLEKTFKNGATRNRHWDFVKYPHGFSIQKNGKTVCGFLSGYGGNQIFLDFVDKDLGNGWKRESDDYIHWHKDSIINTQLGF